MCNSPLSLAPYRQPGTWLQVPDSSPNDGQARGTSDGSSVAPRRYGLEIPRISSFYGIVIWMYHDGHNPLHFHAEYGEYQVRILINSFQPIDQGLPRRALRLVQEWARLHRNELIVNWDKVRAGQSLDTIEPLP